MTDGHICKEIAPHESKKTITIEWSVTMINGLFAVLEYDFTLLDFSKNYYIAQTSQSVISAQSS